MSKQKRNEISIVREELSTIVKQKGILTPEEVVSRAESITSPIHDYFQWDDTEAAYQFRLVQARRLISQVKVVIEGENIQAFHNLKVSIGKETTQGYFFIGDILKDDSMKEQMLSNALRDLEHWQKKYEDLSQLKGLVNTKKLKELRANI